MLSIMRVLVGYVLACLAVGGTFTLLVEGPVVAAGRETLDEFFAIMFIATMGFSVYAAAPALICIILGEARGITSWMFFAFAGLFIALATAWYSGFGGTKLVIAGLIGGLVYWGVSGRSAGNWISKLVGLADVDNRSSAKSWTKLQKSLMRNASLCGWLFACPTVLDEAENQRITRPPRYRSP